MSLLQVARYEGCSQQCIAMQTGAVHRDGYVSSVGETVICAEQRGEGVLLVVISNTHCFDVVLMALVFRWRQQQ